MAVSDYSRLIKDFGDVLLKTVLSQPLEFVRVLMTIGYEPTPPVETHHFGKIVLRYPGLVSYVVHVYNVDGVTGFLPGLKPRVLVAILRYSTEKTIDQCLPLKKKALSEEGKARGYINYIHLIKNLVKDVVYSVAQILVTHPFHVVACRTIAQFIGRETKYDDVWSSLRIIYTEQGVAGLYSGVIPRIIRDVSHILIATSVIFAIKAFFRPSKHVIRMAGIMTMISKHFSYSLHVVATCMAVNDSSLKAGSVPYVPIYTGGWMDCYSHLLKARQLNRGQFPLFRLGFLPDKSSVITDEEMFEVLKVCDPTTEFESTKEEVPLDADTPEAGDGGNIEKVIEPLDNLLIEDNAPLPQD